MKEYGGVDVYFHVVGGEWSASRPYRFAPEKKLPVPIGWEAGWTPEPVWTTLKIYNSTN
jgi:hypothetical protein